MQGTDSTGNRAENEICELQDRMVEITELEQNKEKRTKKKRKKIKRKK